MYKKLNPIVLPQNLQKASLETEKFYVDLMNRGKYVEAIKTLERLYTKILDQQEKNKCRYHKGGPLHNIGFTYVYLNELNIALEYFLFAFTEDVLTTNLLDEDPFEMPAAQNLLNFYKITKESLLDYKKRILEISEKVYIHDPLSQNKLLKKNLHEEEKIEKTLKEKKKIIQWYDISNIPGELSKRVFIGGKYGGDLETIEIIKDAVLKKGYTAIIARECEMDTETMPDQTYLLLHNCAFAIFDLSIPGGQIAEERESEHYKTVKLLVCHKNHKKNVTAMINREIKTFETEKELRDLVKEFLP